MSQDEKRKLIRVLKDINLYNIFICHMHEFILQHPRYSEGEIFEHVAVDDIIGAFLPFEYHSCFYDTYRTKGII